MIYAKLTPEQAEAYKHSPSTCPFCTCNSVAAYQTDIIDNLVAVLMQCNKCVRTWTLGATVSNVAPGVDFCFACHDLLKDDDEFLCEDGRRLVCVTCYLMEGY